ncbi:MAG: peptidase domain-containing ABC transporter [Gloeomargarita sp. SKYBB_i_bin120]|nr:peptidase domain-containing ABC transporter [Gloeomargarita sp. SKYB120]MDW8177976.1 peptidase domain-containing ABC transporter [Gloeomargarita sp. SKYBB_i_bin120]
MTATAAPIQEFVLGLPFMQALAPAVQQRVLDAIQVWKYRIGQPLLVAHQTPDQVLLLYQGSVRLLFTDPRSQKLVTLARLSPGAVVGWLSALRGQTCETAMAAEESVAVSLPAALFGELWRTQPAWQTYFGPEPTAVEIAEVIAAEWQHQAQQPVDLPLREWVAQLRPHIQCITLQPGPLTLPDVPDCRWWVSVGQVGEYTQGQWLDGAAPHVRVRQVTRLLGVTQPILPESATAAIPVPASPRSDSLTEIPYAPALSGQPAKQASRYPYVQGEGPVGGALACLQMVARFWQLPFRREMLRRLLETRSRQLGGVTPQLMGALVQLLGLDAQLLSVPAPLLTRVETPALVQWQGQWVVLFAVSPAEVVLGVPEQGLVYREPAKLLPTFGDDITLLTLKKTAHTPQKRFGWGWFWPVIWRYRRVLAEVFIASFFVQLFSLANPLMIQIIIDKVLVQNSVSTLHVLGMLLLGIAVAEAVLGALRTYLFVDTTNRMDLALGSAVIDHLLRLPLRYYERRPVGELATRINELENIRQFLTGTALTVVLDAVFSVVYIVVMVIYSWLLTLLALATVPLFALLTLLAAPLMRRQLRTKAERNAETQAYFTEVITGIQTVKAQNLELTARWRWQGHYGRYISAGFQTVITATTAHSVSNFLNQLSGLLLIWVGAFLVLKGELTLGQLIAFRIIAGYTTSPLLRLVQLWQNFQETALSLERLADIVDTPQEAEDSTQIPMPPIVGAIRLEEVSFRFSPNGPWQLVNISLEIQPGTFVGIVGQSGAGKSTLTKLIARLYTPESGRILIDNYDIAKVDLYSLRQQIGMVLQEPLLFDGTILENIAQSNPDLPIEAIIEAAKIACAHEFIMALPQGYNTRVGERGSALSGGQRQRIALARVLVQQPRLLILDEATSALDYDTEQQVCANLRRAFQGVTVLFVTHRLSTIRQADRILVMDKGRIVEDGTHDELMALKGRYYSLYQKQD